MKARCLPTVDGGVRSSKYVNDLIEQGHRNISPGLISCSNNTNLRCVPEQAQARFMLKQDGVHFSLHSTGVRD